MSSGGQDNTFNHDLSTQNPPAIDPSLIDPALTGNVAPPSAHPGIVGQLPATNFVQGGPANLQTQPLVPISSAHRPAHLEVQPATHPVAQPSAPPPLANYQPAQPPLPPPTATHRAGGPARPAAPVRPSPYSRPSRLPVPTKPPPPAPSSGKGKGTNAAKKRKRAQDPGSSASGHGQVPPRAQVLSQAAASGSQNTMSVALMDATRQLAQPRDAPGPPHSDSDADMEDDDMLEELEEAVQAENDEILRIVYDRDGTSNNGGDKQLLRLVARMLQKQDALSQALEHLRQSRRACEHDASLSTGLPARISPLQPRKEVNWDQTVPSTQPAGRQPRAARRVLISDVIRDNVNQLLGRASCKDPLPRAPPPEIRYPTLENFGVRWEESPRSIFNRLAADILVERVRANWKDDPLTPRELVQLPNFVKEHIRYLKRNWKNAHRDDAEEWKAAALKAASGSSRRTTLFHCRLLVIDTFPEQLGMHRNLLVQVGREGMSSDEEDPERPGVYLIKRRPEFGADFTILKSKLDLTYNLYLKGPGSKGSQLHMREPSDLVSTREIRVHGLPITVLSRSWLKSLSEPEKQLYGFSGHKYDYSYPDELLRRRFGRDPDAIAASDSDEELD